MEARLVQIAEAEGLQLGPEIIPALIRASDGDMRRSITYLQSVARLATARGGDVRSMPATTVSELAGVVPIDVIESLARSIGINIGEEKLEPASGSDFDRISRAVDSIVREGYSCMQVVLQVRGSTYTAPRLYHYSPTTEWAAKSAVRSSARQHRQGTHGRWPGEFAAPVAQLGPPPGVAVVLGFNSV